MKKFLKGTLSLLLAVIMVISVAAPALPSIQLAPKASAATFNSKSTISLVTPKKHKSASTHYMYGNADYLCIRIDSTTDRNDMFYFVLYSDSAYKTKIGSYSTSAYKGTTYIDLPFDLTSLKTKTYYAKVYVKKYNYDTGKMATDSKTVKKYTVKVNKKGTSLDKMNTVMYGYENTENGLRVYWYKVPKATKYYVYRKFSTAKSFVKIGTVKATSDVLQSFVDKKNLDTYAQYKVVAADGTKKTPGSLIVLNGKAFKTPKVRVDGANNNKIQVDWESVGNSSTTRYTVYCRTDSTDWTKVYGPTKKLQYFHNLSNAEGNQNYYFTVIATNGNETSGFDSKNGKIRFIRYPVLKKCAYPEEGGITVNWELSEGADGYIIYRAPQKGKTWTEIARVSKGITSYTDTTVDNTNAYSYTVRGTYKGKNGSRLRKGVCGIKMEEPVIKNVSSVDTTVTFSWDDSAKANLEYEVYLKNGSAWKRVNTVNTTSFKTTVPYEIAQLIYTVQPKCTNTMYVSNNSSDSNYLRGAYDKTGVTVNVYPNIKMNKAYATAAGLYFSWEAPLGAESYVIYRKTENSEYELLCETSENQFVDTTAQKDVLYTYKVVYKYNGELIESAALEKQLGYYEAFVEAKCTNSSTPGDSHEFELGKKTSGVKYDVYSKQESGWVFEFTTDSVFSLSNSHGKKYDYGYVKIYDDIWVTTLPETVTSIQLPYIPKITNTVEDGKITFKWNDTKGSIDSFDIYVSTQSVTQQKTSGKKYVATVNALDLEYTFEMDDNTAYTFSFYAKKDGICSKEKKYSYNNASEIKIKYKYTTDCLRISWNRIPGAKSYTIYEEIKGEGDYYSEQVATVKVTDYNKTDMSYDMKMLSGKCRNNKIYVTANVSGSSSFVSKATKVPLIPAPKALGESLYAIGTSEGLKLEFSKVSGCDRYIIEYYNTNTKKWVKLGTSEGASKNYYLDKTIKVNKQRQYRVCAEWKGIKGPYAKMNCIRLKEPTVTLTPMNRNTLITASKYSYDVTYNYYYKAPGGYWKYFMSSSSNKCEGRRPMNGDVHRYTVSVEKYDSKTDTYSVSSYNTKGWVLS